MASEILNTMHQSHWFFSLQGNVKSFGIFPADISWGDIKKKNQGKYQILAGKFMRSRVFFIHMLVRKKQQLEKICQTTIITKVSTILPGMMRIMILNIN